MAEPLRRTKLHHGYRFKNRFLIWALRGLDAVLGLFPSRRAPLPDRPRGILIMKPDHLGDLVMLTAVLPLLADCYPYAAIDILCGPWGETVLGNNPAIRRIIPFHHLLYDRRKVSFDRKLLDFWKSLMHTLKVIRGERYDLCLNLRDAGGDMILLARLGGCKHIVGHGTGGGRALLDTVVQWQEGRHEVEHYLEVLQPLGIDAKLPDLDCHLFPCSADQEKVNELLDRHDLKKFVVIQPGSGDPRKLKPALFWAEMIGSLATDCRVVLTGSSEEIAICREIAGLCSRETVCLAGKMTVAQLYLFMQSSTAVYALDSLAAHLGAAAGVPVKVFWSRTNDATQWRPLGAKVEIIAPQD